MGTRLIEFAIVVVASDCNPTILNPDFLAGQSIVPSEWGWGVSGTPITTPPFATISYDSGVSILVEANKFQVSDKSISGKGPEPDTSKIPEIAKRYIEVLPHVRYDAVGHNFTVFVENAEAVAFLKDKFLKEGVWDSETHHMQEFGLKFVYHIKGGRLNVAMDGATIIDRSLEEPKEVRGILIKANHHRDCEGYPSNEQVIEYLEHIQEDWNKFQAILADILGANNVS